MANKPEIYLDGKDQIPLPKLPTWDREKCPRATRRQNIIYGS